MSGLPRILAFGSRAVDGDSAPLLVTAIRGEEKINQAYRFEIELVSTRTDFNAAELIQKPAWIEIRQPVSPPDTARLQAHEFHGVLASFDMVGTLAEGAVYRAVLVSRLWRASLGYRSRIFLDQTIPEIVSAVLTDSQDNYGILVDASTRLTKTYAPREFVMQYSESDLHFALRWLAHEGINYYFEQTADGEKMVLCDDKAGFPAIPQSAATLNFTPQVVSSDRRWFDESAIYNMTYRHNPLPAKVVLKDYNYRNPEDPLLVEEAVGANGHGVRYEYRNHYRTETHGRALAAVRKEEVLSGQIRLLGDSNCQAFRAGHTFRVSGHFAADLTDKDILLLEVHHEARQTVHLTDASIIDAHYVNRFVAMPADRQFRPERAATWPRVQGCLHARIDGPAGQNYAQIDSQGRYHVKFLLDLSDRSGGNASCPIRMAQPYAGASMGMHFPLHVGTEVLVGFSDGDPDRPVILGSVPNPATGSPVIDTNSDQGIIRSAQAQITMTDLLTEENIALNAQGRIGTGNSITGLTTASLKVGATGDSTGKVSTTAFAVSEVSTFMKSVISGWSTSFASMSKFKVTVGFRMILVLAIALKVGQSALADKLRDEKRSGKGGIWLSYILYPLINLVGIVGIGALVSKLIAKQAKVLSPLALTKVPSARDQNLKWTKRLAQGAASLVKKAKGPFQFIASVLTAGSFAAAWAVLQGTDSDSVQARKDEYGVNLTRVPMGTLFEIDNGGESLHFATQAGSIDMVCPSGQMVHHANQVLVTATGDIDLRVEGGPNAGGGAAVAIWNYSLNLWGPGEKSNLRLDEKEAYLNYGTGDANAIRLTEDGAAIVAKRLMVSNTSDNSCMVLNDDGRILIGTDGDKDVSIEAGGGTRVVVNASKGVTVQNRSAGGTVSIGSDGKILITAANEVQITGASLKLAGNGIQIDAKAGNLELKGAQVAINGQAVGALGAPVPAVPGPPGLPALPLVPVPPAVPAVPAVTEDMAVQQDTVSRSRLAMIWTRWRGAASRMASAVRSYWS